MYFSSAHLSARLLTCRNIPCLLGFMVAFRFEITVIFSDARQCAYVEEFDLRDLNFVART